MASLFRRFGNNAHRTIAARRAQKKNRLRGPYPQNAGSDRPLVRMRDVQRLHARRASFLGFVS
jgi:hypothetical protein